MITSHNLKTQTDYFDFPCILCGQGHAAITEDIDVKNKIVTTCINCPIITRTDPPDTPFDKSFNFRWCPSKLASNYGYQLEDVKDAWLTLTQTRYARILVPKPCLDRLLGKALKACELERVKWTFKRASCDDEDDTEI
jgi:hypothetical protein